QNRLVAGFSRSGPVWSALTGFSLSGPVESGLMRSKPL
ncbi:hypothetical protein CP02DC21_1808, partial [Chlamydia psittaci 02DC21]